jgi:hypothetical protein
LTAAFTAAVLDYTIRVGRAPDPDEHADPCNLVPLLPPLLLLIRHGQSSGELRSYPPAVEISRMVLSLMLVRSINRKDEPPEATADLLLTLLLRTLRADQATATCSPDSSLGVRQ